MREEVKSLRKTDQYKELQNQLSDVVEPGILDLTIILNILGFKTFASCEGHGTKDDYNGPYILIDCESREDLRKKKLEMEGYLKNFYKNRAIEDVRNQIIIREMENKSPNVYKFVIKCNLIINEPGRGPVIQNIYLKENLKKLQREFRDFTDSLITSN